MSSLTSHWKKRMGYLVFALAIMVSLSGLGFWMIQSPERAQSLNTFAAVSFWWLTVFRWIAYMSVIIGWTRIVGFLVEALVDTESRPKVTDNAVHWRWPLLRVFIVYELLFPFNLIAMLGSWL